MYDHFLSCYGAVQGIPPAFEMTYSLHTVMVESDPMLVRQPPAPGETLVLVSWPADFRSTDNPWCQVKS